MHLCLDNVSLCDLKPFKLERRNHDNLEYSLPLEYYSVGNAPEIRKVEKYVWDDLGLSYKGRQAKTCRAHLAALLTNLYVAWETPGNPFLAVALGAGKYSPGEELYSKGYRYAYVKRIVNALKSLSLIEYHSGYFDGEKGRLTRIRANTDLVRLFLEYRFPVCRLTLEKDLIVLRDKKKDSIDISRGKYAQAAKEYRKRVEELNAFHGSAEWVLAMPEEEFLKWFIRWEAKIIPPNPARVNFHRVFNESFDRGGRFYGIWPQSLPRELRKYIQINGQAVQERDYNALHPTMLYARENLPLEGDPYVLEHYGYAHRKPVKLLFNTALNAGSKEDALKGFRHKVFKEEALGVEFHHCTKDEWLRPAYEAICYWHRPIEKYLSSGVGIELQRQDSEMAEFVLTRLMQLGIHAIPIHDSFMVQAQHDECLHTAMKEASREIVGIEIETDVKYVVDNPFDVF